MGKSATKDGFLPHVSHLFRRSTKVTSKDEKKSELFSLFEPRHGSAKLCVPGLTIRNIPLHTVHTATAPPATMTMDSTYSPTANIGCLTG